MKSLTIRTVIGWALSVILALAFLASAVAKLTGVATPMFAHWGYPPWFAKLIGVLELAGAVGLLIPKATRYAILGLTVLMLGAGYTHLTNQEGIQVLRPVIFLAVLWIVWWLRVMPRNGAAAS
jgi:putative oxidoreductase